MQTVLMCIPLKKGCLDQFQNFVKQTSAQKATEWKSMLARYDILNVKIWHKNLAGVDYAFVYHKVGTNFLEKIKGWNTSQHSFDQWFNQQIMAVYDTGPVDAGATSLLELVV
jgi:hypothetical protein